jgi:cell division protease FtsH
MENNDAVDSEKVSSITYSIKDDNFIATFYDSEKNEIGSYSSPIELRINDLRKKDDDEFQALCALHESGHFVVYSKLYGLLPEKLVSKCVSNNVGGFLMKDDKKSVPSKRKLLNDIMVSLGGYAAEKLCFGEMERSSGASQDLSSATYLAGRMVRELGMYSQTYVSYPVTSGDLRLYVDETLDKESEANSLIKEIINDCLTELNKIFEDDDWRNMLRKSALYLSSHASMPKNVMKEIYETVPLEKRQQINMPNSNYYRNKIANL